VTPPDPRGARSQAQRLLPLHRPDPPDPAQPADRHRPGQGLARHRRPDRHHDPGAPGLCAGAARDPERPADPLAAAAAGLAAGPAAEGRDHAAQGPDAGGQRPRLGRYDAIVTPERTTALLRKLGVRDSKLVYTQHGAGDRGGPFEPRLKQFDLVMAAGPKQRDRMLDEGWVTQETCAMVGYPKFDIIDALPPRRCRTSPRPSRWCCTIRTSTRPWARGRAGAGRFSSSSRRTSVTI
jgi:hypothetical protein